MTPFRFALREIRHRPAYAALFVVSLGFGAAVMTALSGFGAAAAEVIQGQARELWAADITVEASEPTLARVEAWARGRWPGLRAARKVDVLSMARFPDGKVVQVSIDAATPGYPLYGRIETASGRPLREVLVPGAVVVGPKLLAETGAQVGGTLRLGTLDLTLADTIASRTDIPFSFFELSPAVLMTTEDLARSGLVVPGSRTMNTLYMNLPPGTDLPRALAEVKALAAEETTEVASWSTDNPGVLRFFKNTLLYLQFLGLLTLTLGGVGAASTLSAAMAASGRSMGMVFALGAPRSYALRVWSFWVLVLTAAGLAASWVLGQAVAGLLTRVFGDFLPGGFRLGFPWGAFLRASAVGGAASLLFVTLPLLKLTDIPPNSVLANEAPALPLRWGRTALVASGSWVIFFLLVLAQVRRPLLAAEYMAGLTAVLGLAWLLSAGIMALFRRASSGSRLLAPRLAGRGLARPDSLNDAVVVSVAVSLAVILALLLLERNITRQFIESFPADAPNIFFVNVQREQAAAFRRTAGDVRLFPLIRGRVTEVNGVPVRELNRRAETRRGRGDRLTREFGLTFGEDLLPTDRVSAGGALWDPRIQGPQVSVFDEYHRRFGIRIGDKITFNVLGRRVTATVSSLRAINQSMRQPFFYFYFRPGALDGAPYTLMGGAHVPRERVVGIQKDLARELPNVTVIDLSDVAALTARILARLARIVNALGFFGVGSGLLLLVSSLWTTLVARTREAVLYRTLGASGGQLARVYLLEYALIAAAGTGTALLVGQAAAWAALRFAFRLPFSPEVLASARLVGAAGLVLVGASWLATRRAFRTAPMEVLRYE